MRILLLAVAFLAALALPYGAGRWNHRADLAAARARAEQMAMAAPARLSTYLPQRDDRLWLDQQPRYRVELISAAGVVVDSRLTATEGFAQHVRDEWDHLSSSLAGRTTVRVVPLGRGPL